MTRIAVISDSHNQIRPEVEALLRSADAVIHAGDIACDETYDALKRINGRTTFVRGNMDRDLKVRQLPSTQALSLGGFEFYVLHDLGQLDLDPSGRFNFVVYGHSHRANEEQKDGVTFLNPGSIGPQRFNNLPSFASIELSDGEAKVTFHTL